MSVHSNQELGLSGKGGTCQPWAPTEIKGSTCQPWDLTEIKGSTCQPWDPTEIKKNLKWELRRLSTPSSTREIFYIQLKNDFWITKPPSTLNQDQIAFEASMNE